MCACGGATTTEGPSGPPSTAITPSDTTDDAGPLGDGADAHADAGAVTMPPADASADAPADAPSGCVLEKEGRGGADCTPAVMRCGAIAEPLICADLCPKDTVRCNRDPASVERVQCWYSCGGRRPAGFVEGVGEDHHEGPLASVGAFFANLAELEAASIDAFAILADELAVHGAPASLVADAHAAADDEVRHAKIAGALARREGHPVSVPHVVRQERRSLLAMAVENAAEGCVRETFGALLAMHQAEHAADPAIRSAMGKIAEDETRHATLAWRVAAWANERLCADDRATVDRAMIDALDALEAAPCLPAEDLRLRAGVPSARVGARLVSELRRELARPA